MNHRKIDAQDGKKGDIFLVRINILHEGWTLLFLTYWVIIQHDIKSHCALKNVLFFFFLLPFHKSLEINADMFEHLYRRAIKTGD